MGPQSRVSRPLASPVQQTPAGTPRPPHQLRSCTQAGKCSLDPACRSGGRAEGEDAARHPCQAQSSLTCSRGARYAVGEPSRHPVLVLSRAAHSSARSWRGAGGERLVSLLCHLDRKPSARTLFIIILVLKIVAKHTWQFPVRALRAALSPGQGRRALWLLRVASATWRPRRASVVVTETYWAPGVPPHPHFNGGGKWSFPCHRLLVLMPKAKGTGRRPRELRGGGCVPAARAQALLFSPTSDVLRHDLPDTLGVFISWGFFFFSFLLRCCYFASGEK